MIALFLFCLTELSLVSGIGAVVKVVDSHLCRGGSIPGESYSFLIASLSKGLSLCSVFVSCVLISKVSLY